MKMLMYTNININDKRFIGVLKKINGQLAGFESHDIKSDIIYMKDYKVVWNVNKSLKYFIPSCNKDKYNRIIDIINKNKYDMLYIRYPLSDFYLLNFLEKLKDTNKQIKIVLEFPTFPYDSELEKEISKLYIDKYFRKYLHQFVDLAVSYHTSDPIFEIPTIKIKNGIDIESIQLIKNENVEKNILNMIAVANISKWHGYDRLIYGLYKYYLTCKEANVFLNIVGVGDELNKLISLVNKLGLNEYVYFHGAQTGHDLNDIYNNCQIAIASLGLHRIGIVQGDTLKAREYCAKGIPFILSYCDADFENNFQYTLKVEGNEEFIDINLILEFYNNVYKDKNLRNNMRFYAEENLTWQKKIEPIINQIIENNEF